MDSAKVVLCDAKSMRWPVPQVMALFLVMLCLVIAILAPTVSFCMAFFIRSPLLQYSGSSIIFKSTPVGFACMMCTLNFAHKDAI